MNHDSETGCLVLLAVAFIVLAGSCGGCFEWYKAGSQANVYKRSGIEMSQLEVFIGTKPPERTINLREQKQ